MRWIEDRKKIKRLKASSLRESGFQDNIFERHGTDRNQTQKSTCSMIPFTLHFITGKNNLVMERSAEACGWGWEADCKRAQENLWGMAMFYNWTVVVVT